MSRKSSNLIQKYFLWKLQAGRVKRTGHLSKPSMPGRDQALSSCPKNRLCVSYWPGCRLSSPVPLSPRHEGVFRHFPFIEPQAAIMLRCPARFTRGRRPRALSCSSGRSFERGLFGVAPTMADTIVESLIIQNRWSDLPSVERTYAKETNTNHRSGHRNIHKAAPVLGRLLDTHISCNKRRKAG